MELVYTITTTTYSIATSLYTLIVSAVVFIAGISLHSKIEMPTQTNNTNCVCPEPAPAEMLSKTLGLELGGLSVSFVVYYASAFFVIHILTSIWFLNKFRSFCNGTLFACFLLESIIKMFIGSVPFIEKICDKDCIKQACFGLRICIDIALLLLVLYKLISGSENSKNGSNNENNDENGQTSNGEQPPKRTRGRPKLNS